MAVDENGDWVDESAPPPQPYQSADCWVDPLTLIATTDASAPIRVEGPPSNSRSAKPNWFGQWGGSNG